jgi:hypothetical protein
MPDDTRFLAAANLALAIVELFGTLPGKRKAESVGILTFYLLDWLHAQDAKGG